MGVVGCSAPPLPGAPPNDRLQFTIGNLERLAAEQEAAMVPEARVEIAKLAVDSGRAGQGRTNRRRTGRASAMPTSMPKVSETMSANS
jgi:hypothetical protein